MTESLEVPDAELIAAVREGDVAAYGMLYERYLVVAKRAAACLANTPAEREDLVAEAFTRVLRMLREGRGPDADFRPYLLVTLRNVAINITARGAPVSLYADVPDVAPAEAVDDPVIERWHATVAADAFASLPERWRVVLWHTEVQNESPATVAPLLGMRPNSVAALAYRAREGLRQAYLRMHVPEVPRSSCRPVVAKLAGYVRHSIPLPLSRKIGRHLTGCSDCRARAESLTNVNEELRGSLGPVLLGAPLAAASLPASAAVTGAASGAVTGAVPAAMSSAVSGAVAGGFSGAVSGALVKVATALVVAATAASTASAISSSPAEAVGMQVAAPAVRHPAVGQGSGTLGRSGGAATAPVPA
ncbi:MAG: RNA polymerase sigma factor, partial [Actinophytocola sp.]|uniref:RNA polymerase sigma factor n=1 Tax=Actinophytocola sp. TaxID=1872138 RepID=UPI003D6BAC1F